jgi:UDP-N-acetylmuramyl pentapeptide phosphotransferase/UDP-N-acetylglucosamine-1-phosphate transferase
MPPSCLAWCALGVIGGATVAWAAIRLLLPFLRARALDQPNARSSHSVPTPRGGGIGILVAALPGWALIPACGGAGRQGVVVAAAAGLLALDSWLDDRRSLPASVRFLTQGAVVAAGLWTLPHDRLLFSGALPFLADRIVLALAWMWFVNLFNFMDGIDGLAGGETATICVGVILLAGLGAAESRLAWQAAVLLGGALGFLAWNWPPAKVFMGDVGSAGVGYLLGWLLLKLWLGGFWAPALILPLYFLTDATVTLARRLLARQRVWEAHRDHFYQRAVRGGLSHRTVTARIMGLNTVLIGVAVAGTAHPWTTFAAGLALTAGTLFSFIGRKEGR